MCWPCAGCDMARTVPCRSRDRRGPCPRRSIAYGCTGNGLPLWPVLHHSPHRWDLGPIPLLGTRHDDVFHIRVGLMYPGVGRPSDSTHCTALLCRRVCRIYYRDAARAAFSLSPCGSWLSGGMVISNRTRLSVPDRTTSQPTRSRRYWHFSISIIFTGRETMRTSVNVALFSQIRNRVIDAVENQVPVVFQDKRERLGGTLFVHAQSA